MNIEETRLKYLDKYSKKYLMKVLNRLPPDIQQKIINDKNLHFITATDSIHPAKATFFDSPVKVLIWIGFEKAENISATDFNDNDHDSINHIMKYLISHELAHYILWKQKGNLNHTENDADQLIKQWGFGKEFDYYKKVNGI